jgi:hypothetical protein
MAITATEVATAILNGKLDGEFDTIREAMKQRKDAQSAILKASLKIGDRVRFISGSPKYLIGLEAIVRDKKQKRIGIEFVDKIAAKRFGYGVVTCTPSMVEPIPTVEHTPDTMMGSGIPAGIVAPAVATPIEPHVFGDVDVDELNKAASVFGTSNRPMRDASEAHVESESFMGVES